MFTSVSAAVAHGLEVPWEDIGYLSITKNPKHPVMIDGMRVTSLDDTVIDCMMSLPFSHGLAVADSYLRMTGRSREDLLGLLMAQSHRREGIVQARATASFADGRAENGGEARARAAMIELVFQAPDLQVSY